MMSRITLNYRQLPIMDITNSTASYSVMPTGVNVACRWLVGFRILMVCWRMKKKLWCEWVEIQSGWGLTVHSLCIREDLASHVFMNRTVCSRIFFCEMWKLYYVRNGMVQIFGIITGENWTIYRVWRDEVKAIILGRFLIALRTNLVFLPIYF